MERISFDLQDQLEQFAKATFSFLAHFFHGTATYGKLTTGYYMLWGSRGKNSPSCYAQGVKDENMRKYL